MKVFLLAGFLTLCSGVHAQDYGIEFVRIGAVNNPAFSRNGFPDYSNYPSNGRGSVSYEYRIGKYEVTTSQWLEFVNTFNTVAYEQRPAFFDYGGPYWWGVIDDPAYHGPGFRYILNPDRTTAGQEPVFGISWRMGGLYCNWLHNGKSSDPASLLTGAYDVSTWGTRPNGTITDAATHMPGARFWIPTFDEQMKAFHYDPNRFGPGEGGYWLDKNKSDVPGIPGPPGIGTTTANYEDPNTYNGALQIPLGAYLNQTSPWGLYDTSGGVAEWNELLGPRFGDPGSRHIYGQQAGRIGQGGVSLEDSIYSLDGTTPAFRGGGVGIRLASVVPSPGVLPVYFVVLSGAACLKRRRKS